MLPYGLGDRHESVDEEAPRQLVERADEPDLQRQEAADLAQPRPARIDVQHVGDHLHAREPAGEPPGDGGPQDLRVHRVEAPVPQQPRQTEDPKQRCRPAASAQPVERDAERRDLRRERVGIPEHRDLRTDAFGVEVTEREDEPPLGSSQPEAVHDVEDAMRHAPRH